MAKNAFAPDVIAVQDLEAGQVDQFIGQVRLRFGTHYAIVHSDTGYDPLSDSNKGKNAVIWNTRRLDGPPNESTPTSSTRVQTWKQWVGAPSCTLQGPRAIGVDLKDKLNANKHVVVASVHFERVSQEGEDCLRKNANTADNKLEQELQADRDMTILAGDFNRKPDDDLEAAGHEAPLNGLEPDPDCWYLGISAAHADNSSLDLQPDCNSLAKANRYYDTVWLYPGTGGGTNPTATSFCEQWTHAGDLKRDVIARLGTNSCTDTDLDGKLDNGRIDYIWVAREKDGVKYTPPAQVAAASVTSAGADLGISTSDESSLLDAYSDHRAVQALLTWPAVMP